MNENEQKINMEIALMYAHCDQIQKKVQPEKSNAINKKSTVFAKSS